MSRYTTVSSIYLRAWRCGGLNVHISKAISQDNLIETFDYWTPPISLALLFPAILTAFQKKIKETLWQFPKMGYPLPPQFVRLNFFTKMLSSVLLRPSQLSSYNYYTTMNSQETCSFLAHPFAVQSLTRHPGILQPVVASQCHCSSQAHSWPLLTTSWANSSSIFSSSVSFSNPSSSQSFRS